VGGFLGAPFAQALNGSVLVLLAVFVGAALPSIRQLTA